MRRDPCEITTARVIGSGRVQSETRAKTEAVTRNGLPPPTYAATRERSRGAPSDPGAFCRVVATHYERHREKPARYLPNGRGGMRQLKARAWGARHRKEGKK
jgi:hypothetical protein